MIYYYRTDVCKGVDVNKTSASKECIICQYRYFLDQIFTFQPTVCNRCHDVLLMMAIDINIIAILNIHGVDYCYIIKVNSKGEAINVLENADLCEDINFLSNIKNE